MNHVLSSSPNDYVHSVLNPANYQLLKNGSVLSGGISQVYYGLDIANQLGSQYGLNVPAMNKYEVGSFSTATAPLRASCLFRMVIPIRGIRISSATWSATRWEAQACSQTAPPCRAL